MRNIGIINCYNVAKKCSSSGCFKALYEKSGSFERYIDEEIRIISFVYCNGCSENAVNQILERAQRMKKVGVDTIHLSSCIQSKCPYYNQFLEALQKNYDVVGYSHKKKKTL